MSCENEKWKWHLNSLFLCHRKTVGTKVHALRTPTRYVTLHFRDRCGAASLCNKNRAEIIVFYV